MQRLFTQHVLKIPDFHYNSAARSKHDNEISSQ